MRHVTALVSCILVLAACSATGEEYESLEPVVAEVPEAGARIVFLRNSESRLAGARKAMVSIDGARVGGSYIGGFFYRDVPVGEHVLMTDLWDTPGRCEVRLQAEAGVTYFFQLSPREEPYEADFWPYAASLLIDPTGLIGTFAEVGNVAMESQGKQCGGTFRIRQIDAFTARLWLKHLRLSE